MTGPETFPARILPANRAPAPEDDAVRFLEDASIRTRRDSSAASALREVERRAARDLAQAVTSCRGEAEVRDWLRGRGWELRVTAGRGVTSMRSARLAAVADLHRMRVSWSRVAAFMAGAAYARAGQ